MNPGGYATCGAIVYVDGKVEFVVSEYIGNGPRFSNNVAEYAGLLAILRLLKLVVRPGDEVVIYGDSDLVVKQVTGQWKARGGLYLPWYVKARNAFDEISFTCSVTLKWIPREQNQIADQLCRDAMPMEALH